MEGGRTNFRVYHVLRANLQLLVEDTATKRLSFLFYMAVMAPALLTRGNAFHSLLSTRVQDVRALWKIYLSYKRRAVWVLGFIHYSDLSETQRQARKYPGC